MPTRTLHENDSSEFLLQPVDAENPTNGQHQYLGCCHLELHNWPKVHRLRCTDSNCFHKHDRLLRHHSQHYLSRGQFLFVVHAEQFFHETARVPHFEPPSDLAEIQEVLRIRLPRTIPAARLLADSPQRMTYCYFHQEVSASRLRIRDTDNAQRHLIEESENSSTPKVPSHVDEQPTADAVVPFDAAWLLIVLYPNQK